MAIREVKMDHPLHQHPLLLSEWLGNVRARKCKACRKTFSGGDMVYACKKHKFYLHESCTKLPEQIQHFLHPSCPLLLCWFSLYRCGVCLKEPPRAFAYRCDECNFEIDAKCYLQLLSTIAACDGDEEQILHFCHHHPLTLFPGGTEARFSCQVCKLSCSSKQTYGCRSKQCNFYVHKSCLERLPQRILTNLGRNDLIEKEYLGQNVFSLSLLRCRPRWGQCIDCVEQADLGFRCSQMEEHCVLCISCYLVRRMKEESGTNIPQVIRNFFHPCELKLVFAPFSTCNACLETHSDFFYKCKNCDFFLDPQCAQLLEVGNEKRANQIQHFCHWHHLELFGDTADRKNLCKLCENFCLESFYGCSQCHFYIHESCMKILPQKTSYCLHEETVVLVPNPSFVCTTCNRECSGLSFYCGERKCRFCVKCVLWPENVFGDAGRFTSIHHWHQLSLCETRKEDRARCFLCRSDCIDRTYNYKCNECAYYFHKSCAELPRELQHPMHPEHQLIIRSAHISVLCSLCGKFLTSLRGRRFWLYGCFLCEFFLDTQCASSLPSLEQEGHPHPLYLIRNMNPHTICRACRKPCKGRRTFHCSNPRSDSCFELHLTCGPLPVKIKHKCHVHSLILQDYYVEDSEGNDFACHVCEEQRDPRLPVYCCSQGCLMICDVECVLSEVIPLLRGERGEVEVRTPYPPSAWKVICTKEAKLVPTREEAGDGNSGTGDVFSFRELLSSLHVSSFEELISSFPEFGSEEEEKTFGAETSDEGSEPNVNVRTESDESNSSEEEDEGQSSNFQKEVESQSSSSNKEVDGQSSSSDKEVDGQSSSFEEVEGRSRCKEYSYSRKALSRFGEHFRTPSIRELKQDFLWFFDESVTTGDYALPEILNPICEEFFGSMYKITDDKCNLSYPQQRFLIFAVCCVLLHMRMTKVVDVTKKEMLQWLGWIRFVEKWGGLDMGFVVEYIRQFWEAHFYIESKYIADGKSEWLDQRIEEVSVHRAKLKNKLEKAEARLEELKLSKKDHDAYRAAGEIGLKRVRKAALPIKWRTCYESLVRYSRN